MKEQKQILKERKEKGITLIALAVTIAVLIILAVISVNVVFNNDGMIERAKQAQEKSEQDKKDEEKGLKELKELVASMRESTTKGYNSTKQVNGPKLSNGSEENTGLIPIKHNGTNWVVCSEDDRDWYDYSASKMKWANAMLSDGIYKKGTAKVGQVVKDNELGSMFVWIPRYAYSINEYKTAKEGTDGTTQNITKVDFLKGNTNLGASGRAYGTDYDVEKVATGSATPMIVHPAFDFGGAKLQGIWVAKFEASMEETNNNTNANNDVEDKTIKIVPNAESWRSIRIGKIFTTCLNMKNNSNYQLATTSNTHLMKNNEWGAVAYLSASQYGKIPTKNSSGVGTSVGGSGGSYVENGEKKYHAYSAEGNYIANVSQSTTGNITGIYDMNGGAEEYVASYWNNGGTNLKSNGLATYFPNNELNSSYTAYWNKYEVGENERTNGEAIYNTKSTEGNRESCQIAKERVELMKDIKGDAIYEAINEWSYYGRYALEYSAYAPYEYQTWLKPTINIEGNVTNIGEDKLWQYGTGLYGKDYTFVGVYNLPFVRRGGDWEDSEGCGVFNSSAWGGYANYKTGFRPVVVL